MLNKQSIIIKEQMNDTITEILPHKLYLSGYEPAQDENTLRGFGIQHVVRLTETVEMRNYSLLPNVVYYDLIIMRDGKQRLTSPVIDEVLDFIDRANGPVLVHCDAGISRSVIIAMVYLMHHCGISLADSLTIIKNVRTAVRPQINFLTDLMMWSRCPNK